MVFQFKHSLRIASKQTLDMWEYKSNLLLLLFKNMLYLYLMCLESRQSPYKRQTIR